MIINMNRTNKRYNNENVPFLFYKTKSFLCHIYLFEHNFNMTSDGTVVEDDDDSAEESDEIEGINPFPSG